MTFDENESEFVLSTGRRFYSHAAVLGIANDLEPTYGYDGGIADDEFTPDERREISDYVIALWQKWAVRS